VSFLTAFQKYVPSWLSKGEGGLVGSSLAQQMEDMRVRAKLALVARFPEYAAAYVDDAALAAIGRDRRIVRGINEPAASYAASLVRAIDDHRTQGNPYTMLRQIQAYLQARCVVRTVDRRGNWYSLDADGNPRARSKTGNWDWDGRAASPEWARFWVIIYPETGSSRGDRRAFGVTRRCGAMACGGTPTSASGSPRRPIRCRRSRASSAIGSRRAPRASG
jgi:hypothetical protein